jgi:hypothetical protein
MRRIFLAVIAILGFTFTASAQEVKKTVKKAEKTVEAGKKEIKTTTEKVVLKKDGTPDKRYKTVEKTVVLKKDGTPDKRYKEKK